MISQNPIARVTISVIKRLIAQIPIKVNACTNVVVPWESTNVIVQFESTDVIVPFESTDVIVPFESTNVRVKCHT